MNGRVVTVWIPVYVLSTIVKGFTAMASIETATVVPSIVPQVLLLVHKAKESNNGRRFRSPGYWNATLGKGS